MRQAVVEFLLHPHNSCPHIMRAELLWILFLKRLIFSLILIFILLLCYKNKFTFTLNYEPVVAVNFNTVVYVPCESCVENVLVMFVVFNTNAKL